MRLVGLERTDLTINMLRLPFAPEGAWEQLPPISTNWSVRASLRTRRRLKGAWRDHDARAVDPYPDRSPVFSQPDAAGADRDLHRRNPHRL